MRPSHLFLLLLGAFSLCDAAPKSESSSVSSHSQKSSTSTRRVSESNKRSTTSTSRVVSSTKSKSSETPRDAKKSSSSSSHDKSVSKTSRTSSSRKTTKPDTSHDATSSSSKKETSSHQSTKSTSAVDHQTTSSTKSIESQTSKSSSSSQSSTSLKSSTSISKSRDDASSSSTSSTQSQEPISSDRFKGISSTISSTLIISAQHSSDPPRGFILPGLPSKQTTLETSKTATIASASNSSQFMTTSTQSSRHGNFDPDKNESSISTGGAPTSSVTLQKANITQAIKLGHTATKHSLISASGLAVLQTTVINETDVCTDGTFVDSSCFDILDLSSYVTQWWVKHEAECNSKDAKFARCFYALETQYGPSDCAQLNNDAACTQPVWNDFKNAKHGIEHFYIAWNLWNTAGFFLDLWTAIGAAEASSQAGIAAIVTLLDPPQEKTKMEYVLDALSFGLSLYAEGSIFMKALLRSAPQGYGLGGRLFQRGTVNGEYQDWTLIADNLGKCTDIFRATVADELPMIQNDINLFIEWSKISGLSGYRAPLNGLSQNMTQALNTYAISRIIDSQGVIITRAADTDVHALQTNGSKLNWDTGCGEGYDELGVCDTFFFDGKDTYGLTDPLHFVKSYHEELESLFTPKNNAPPLTTGKLLFSGSQNCYESTGKNGGAPPLMDPTDASHIVCLSNAPVCTWAQNGYGPFDNSCKNDPDKEAPLFAFGASGCKGWGQENSVLDINVPKAYLGPGILQDVRGIDELYGDTFCDNVDF